MAQNILTAEEAARAVGEEPTNQRLLDVLPQVDAAIQRATGRDWTQDDPVRPEAKHAARLELAMEYDLLSMEPGQIEALRRAYICALAQLESVSLAEEETAVV